LITIVVGYPQVMTDPRNTDEKPSQERLHEDAEREKALKEQERSRPREEKEPPEPFSGSDH
jgi:hypothetical protein